MLSDLPFARWLVLSIALLLSSLALADDHGRKPPKDGCTFEGGRTVCVEVLRGAETGYVTGLYRSTHRCRARNSLGGFYDGYVWGFDYVWETPITTTTKTQYGNSHIIESEVVEQTVEIRRSFSPQFCR